MGLDNMMEPEVGIAIAATAAIMSPRVRGAIRRGAVYGLAAIIKAGDSLGNAAKGVAGEVQQGASAGAAAASDTVAEARTTARRGTRGGTNGKAKAGE
jgi:hypothetical protein